MPRALTFQTRYQVSKSFDIRWRADSMIGSRYSTSFFKRLMLGDRFQTSERDLRSAALAIEPSDPASYLREAAQFFALMAWKH